MQLRIGITYEDGSAVDATAATVDLVAWERNAQKPLPRLLEERYLADMLWLAWHVLKRKQRISEEFEPWLERVDTMVLGDTEEDTLPLDV